MKRLLLLLSVFWKGCASLTSGPPLLDAGDELLVKAGEPLSLNCTGSKPLHWKTPHQEMYYTVTGSPTESTLAVRELETFDTGYFYCHYENAADFENDKENVDSTYVYVHDETGTGFVKQHLQDETVRAFRTLVIDCTVTHPNLNITLWYNEAEITCQDRVSYDPRKGFTVKTLRHEGTYTCKDGRGHEISKRIAVTAARQIREPEIDGGMTQEYVRGYSFELECWNTDIVTAQLTWTYPNSKAEHRVEEVLNGPFSILTVQNASDSDTGDYTCTASAPGYLPNNVSSHITIVRVRQIKEPQILGWENRDYVRGYSFDLKCMNRDNVDAQLTWTYPNPKAEHRVEQGLSSLVIILMVQNASDSDTGDYTCSASAPGYLPNNAASHINIVRARQIKEPKIDGGMNQEYIRGYSFELECLSEDNVDAQLTWTYPNPKAVKPLSSLWHL